jgi:hypothetical protein
LIISILRYIEEYKAAKHSLERYRQDVDKFRQVWANRLSILRPFVEKSLALAYKKDMRGVGR